MVSRVKCVYPGEHEVVVQESDNPHVFVADHGSYWFVGAQQNTSAYNGLGFLDLSSYQLHKVLFDIRCKHAVVSEVQVRPSGTYRVSDLGQERFFFHDKLACYSFDGSGSVELFLDVRNTNDFGAFSRTHSWEVLSSNPWTVRVRGASGASFVFVCSCKLDIVGNTWVSCATAFDAARSGRSEWFSELFLRGTGSFRIVIAPENQLFEAKQVLAHQQHWEDAGSVWKGDVSLAVASASVDSLLTQTPNGAAGILAGLPWFFQIYTRDEAISAGALIANQKHHLAGRILLREISVILPDGRIPNRFPHSETGSADGVGWAFLRLHQLYSEHREALSSEQWSFVLEQLKTSLSRLTPGCFGVLIESLPQETWMDTTGGVGDTRVGSRIEIQALTLRMLRFAHELCSEFGDDYCEDFRSREHSLLKTTREHLFDGKHLFDGCVKGVPDTTVRPNALLARYIYPWLLSADEWIIVADTLLSQLKTSWGSLTTIASSHELFVSEHTGENDRSYHRGDAWFFVSNLVACALVSLDDKYLDFARQVYAASEKDLLSLGAAGHASEISSAARLESFGCWCQAWSASSFIELSLALGRR